MIELGDAGSFSVEKSDTSSSSNRQISKTMTQMARNSNKIALIMASIAIILALVIAIIVIIVLIFSDIKKFKLIEISANYQRIYPNDTEYIYIPIFGTNEIHGYFFPRVVKINSDFSYKNASIYYFTKYLEIIRKEFGKEKVLWFDAGDQHTGAVELNLSDNEIITDFFNLANITASTMGNHEYDLDYDVIQKKIEKSKFPYLAANVLSNDTHKFKIISNGTNEKNGHKKYIIKNISLSNSKDIIQIAILGVGSKMEKTGTHAISGKGWESFEFDEIINSIKNTTNEIKNNYPNINAIIGIIHSGMDCNNSKTLNLYTKNMSQNCEGELANILNNLDNGFLDAVISGDKSKIVHDWVNDIPVISGVKGGQYTNILYMPFKKIDGKYKLIKNEIKIESPLPNCEKIFNNSLICDNVLNEEDYKISGTLLSYKYHDTKIEVPNILNSLINKYYPSYKEFNEVEICTLIGLNTVVKGNDRSGDAYIPNLITDIIKTQTESDLAILNVDGLRNSWSMGGLTKAEVFSMFPFDDYFCTFEVSGKILKKIIEIIQNGEKSYYATSGLKQTFIINSNNTKKLSELKIYVNNVENDVDDEKVYKVGTIDFIAINYGDDFALVKNNNINLKNVKCENKNETTNWNVKISNALKKMRIINLSKYKNQEHPRLVEIKEESI